MRGRGKAAVLTAALAGLGAVAAQAQALTAREVVKRHIQAAGGPKALRSVTSVRLGGTVNGGGEFLWQTKAPAAYYLEVRHGGTYAREGFGGKSAWREDPAAGARTLAGREEAQARATGAYRNGRFLSCGRDRTRATLLGPATVEGRPAHVVELVEAAGVGRKVYFDAQTYLILKEEQDREGGLEETFFGDYRPVDGVLEPHRIRIRRGAVTLELAVQRVVHNSGVDAALFDFPRQDGAAWPDSSALLERVLDNQSKIEEARDDYTYTKTVNETETDDKGRITRRSERVYEVFHVGGKPVGKLVAQDGRPLSPNESRKEEQRVERSSRDRRRKAGEEPEKDDDEEVTASAMLRVSQLTNPRREPFRGRPALVFDFEPRKGEKARGRVESWIQKLVGHVWIDEDASRLVRLEAYVKDAIKIGGGLILALRPGSSFVFEQELVKGEVWLPSYGEVNAAGRFLLVKGLKVHQTQRFSDYRRFEVETSSEVQLPAQ